MLYQVAYPKLLSAEEFFVCYSMVMEKISEKPVAVGAWGNNYTWEILSSVDTPPVELTTAVACVALVGKNEGVVLTRNQRGWEVLAGHIEPGESPKEALCREALEEGGYTVSSATPFGYRKITALERPLRGSRESAYPYPTSYIAYFYAQTNSPIGLATGKEIIESKVFTKDELQSLADAGMLNQMEHTIIKLGLSAFILSQTN